VLLRLRQALQARDKLLLGVQRRDTRGCCCCMRRGELRTVLVELVTVLLPLLLLLLSHETQERPERMTDRLGHMGDCISH
jgi:hypothetical protein